MEDERIVADEKYSELMEAGSTTIENIKELLERISSAIRTDFKHGVTIEEYEIEGENIFSAEILLFFVVTDLGGSKEDDIKRFIRDGIHEIFKNPSMHKFKAQWSFLVTPE